MAASGAAMIVFGASMTVPSVCLRPMGEEFNLNFAQRGLLGSVLMSGLVVSLLVIGFVADRVGKRHFLSWGMMAMAAGTALTACASGYGILLVARGVVGIGKGAMEALVNPLVAELNPRSAARRLNIVNGLFSVGLVMAAVVTGEILQAGGSWRLAFWMLAPPTILVGLMFATPRYPKPPPAHERAGQWRAFVSSPLFWLLFLAMFLGGGCEAGMTLWGANFVEHELGASARSGALTIALYGTFMALGRFGGGALVTRIGPIWLMTGSAAGCAAATVGLCFVASLHVAWAMFAAGGLFVACFWPTILAVASDAIAVGSSTLFALLAAGGILGCVIFPWAMGALGDIVGLRVGIALLPASMVLQIVVLTAVGAVLRQRQ